MKSLVTILMLAMLLAMAAISSATFAEEDYLFMEGQDGETESVTDGKHKISLRGNNILLPPNRQSSWCDRHKSMCNSDERCCNRKCVDVKKDRSNCGACGRKCKHNEICCSGKCVNPNCDRNNCGRCGNKCKKGAVCVFGMCSYS